MAVAPALGRLRSSWNFSRDTCEALIFLFPIFVNFNLKKERKKCEVAGKKCEAGRLADYIPGETD